MGSSYNPAQFIPYVQLHEFEALVFSDPRAMADRLAAVKQTSPDRLFGVFSSIVEEAGGPEDINDHHHTCPSKRIMGIVAGYGKPLHGPLITQQIGLDVLRAKCPHFGAWLTKLESLGNPTR